MRNMITQRMTIARLTSMGLGSILIAVSLLVGTLISPAAANDRGRADELRADVDPGYAVIERDATDDMRLVTSTPSRFTGVNGLAAGNRRCAPDRRHRLRGRSTALPDRPRPEPVHRRSVARAVQHLVDRGRRTEPRPSAPRLPASRHRPVLRRPAGRPVAIIDGDDCIDFDPLTEPRIARSHSGDEVVEFRMYRRGRLPKLPLRPHPVVSGPIRACVHEAGDIGDKVVMNGGGGAPNATCWNLDEGYWNLSGHDADARLVTLADPAGAGGPFAFDDIRITER